MASPAGRRGTEVIRADAWHDDGHRPGGGATIMLIRHGAMYFLARGGAGLVAFLSIYIYTRLLDPDEYGLYAMLLSAMSIMHAVFFHWLNIGLGRFYPAYEAQRKILLSTVMVALLAMVALIAGISILMGVFIADHVIVNWAAIVAALACSLAWFELNLRLANAGLKPLAYGLLSLSKAVLGLGLGVVLYRVAGVYGVLAGVFLSAFIVPLFFSAKVWSGIRFNQYDPALLRRFLGYGMPLALTMLLTLVIDMSDRFLVAIYWGAEASGLYSAAYDLVQQAIGVPVAVVYLAAFPLIVRDMEQAAPAPQRQRIESHALLLILVALPLSILFLSMPGNTAEVLLGEQYRGAAEQIMPLIAIAILLGCLKLYFFDLGFQLGHDTLRQVWPTMVAALANIVLNVLWIPAYGLQGAAYATIIAFAIGLIMSAVMVRRVCAMPMPLLDVAKVVAAGLIMAGVLVAFSDWRGMVAWFMQLSMGVLAYGAALIGLDVARIRPRLAQIFSR